MSLWLIIPASLFIVALCIFVLAVLMMSLSAQGGNTSDIDMSIYSAGDSILLKRHLRFLLILKIVAVIWPIVCVLTIVMLWIGYFNQYEPTYYWWLLLPFLYCVLLFYVTSRFEYRAEYAFRPSHQMIAMQYFKCEANRRLEGGIYGKGPMIRLGPHYCRGWVEIDNNEFKLLAREWYGVNLD